MQKKCIWPAFLFHYHKERILLLLLFMVSIGSDGFYAMQKFRSCFLHLTDDTVLDKEGQQ